MYPEAQPETEDVESLASIRLFADLSQGEIEGIVGSIPARAACKGTVSYTAEDGPAERYLLGAGKVELCRRSPVGKKLTLGIVSKGAFFGEMSLIGEHRSGTGAIVTEDSVYLSLSGDMVRAVMLEYPSVAVRMVEALAHRLKETRESLQEMAFNDVTGRVASLLLLLADDDTGIVEDYSYQVLASMVGCLRESITLTLDRFKGNGAVAIGRMRIEIVDRPQLHRIVSQRSGPER
jgi:CRP/FNR family transcriptional regulator